MTLSFMEGDHFSNATTFVKVYVEKLDITKLSNVVEQNRLRMHLLIR